MSEALVPREGQTSTVSPLSARSYTSVRTGRPVAASMREAQFTFTNGCAVISLPLVRSITYMKPFLLALSSALRTWPSMRRSARTGSAVPSKSKLSFGMY